METMETNDKMQREIQVMRQYRTYYEERNPLPRRQVYASDNRLIYFALTALVIASVIVSAYHTIPIFVGDELNLITFVVGLAVFTMIELGIVSLTYINIKKSYELNSGKHADVLKWLRAGLALVFIVGVGANVYSTTKSAGFTAPIVDLLIRIVVGLSAPVTAFVCGEVLAMTGVDGQSQQRVLDRQFDAEMVEYQDKFLQAWDARKARIISSVVVSKEASVSSPMDAVGQSIGQNIIPAVSTLGHKKVPNASELAREYFLAHPEALNIPARELVDVIGAGKSTINNVQNQMKGGSE